MDTTMKKSIISMMRNKNSKAKYNKFFLLTLSEIRKVVVMTGIVKATANRTQDKEKNIQLKVHCTTIKKSN